MKRRTSLPTRHSRTSHRTMRRTTSAMSDLLTRTATPDGQITTLGRADLRRAVAVLFDSSGKERPVSNANRQPLLEWLNDGFRPLCSAEMSSGRRDLSTSAFSVLRFSGQCSSLRERRRRPSEYSWCSPPSTDFARTSAPGVHRRRDSGFEARADPAGGPGTPGPSLLCGRPRL